ncbi:hypothetical protein [Spirosoma foliorum]|uniref:Uncharacterized protein n=1 Tax=Spirosoma foliorum TaxID=2710596 RepID=A0A7G5GWS7_9BACT|nr:hypothetical protein [Spirosoma foliorum]QMW03319.1 hypothetical protein H3H32_36620 [Spirosoma foliorum]
MQSIIPLSIYTLPNSIRTLIFWVTLIVLLVNTMGVTCFAAVRDSTDAIPVKTIRVYSPLETAALGLHPVVLENGELLHPFDDGQHYFVDPQGKRLADPITGEQVEAIFTKAKEVGKTVTDLLALNFVSKLPVVISKDIGGVTYELAIDELVFTPTGNFLTIVARVPTPDGTSLYFGARNLEFSGSGGIKSGDIQLLAAPFLKSIPLGDKISVQLTGPGNKFSFDCNGFKSISLEGLVTFDRSLIVPDNPETGEPGDGQVQSRFSLANIGDWNNMLIRISLQPFQMAKMKGFSFVVQEAYLDLSDAENPANFALPLGYATTSGELWRGVYIGKVAVRFPKYFKKRTGGGAHRSGRRSPDD